MRRRRRSLLHDPRGTLERIYPRDSGEKGDFIQIDPGTVHAIKGGLLILETQQNSDITYRVYDYDRLQNGKPRELHIEKSIDVITVPAKSVEDSVTSALGLPENRLNELYACGYYQIYKLDVNGTCSFAQNHPFLLMSVLEGGGIVNGQPVKKRRSLYFTVRIRRGGDAGRDESGGIHGAGAGLREK